MVTSSILKEFAILFNCMFCNKQLLNNKFLVFKLLTIFELPIHINVDTMVAKQQAWDQAEVSLCWSRISSVVRIGEANRSVPSNNQFGIYACSFMLTSFKATVIRLLAQNKYNT